MDDSRTVLRFRARDIPAHERRVVLQESFCRGILNVDWTPLGEELDFELETRWIADVTISRGYNTQHTVDTHDRAQHGEDFILVWSSGGGVITHRNKDLESVTDAAFLSSSEHISARSKRTLHHRTIRLPRKRLEYLLPKADDLLACRLPKRSEGFQLLDGYAGLLLTGHGLSDPTAAQLAANHVCELVAHVVGSTTTDSKAHELGGVTAARLQKVKAWALRRLHDPQLSIGSAAAAHRLSERYIQMLFRTEHSSFSAFVRAERLALACRYLVNPSLQSQPISGIAFRVGFGDVSHFNRSFRATYGMTPSEMRENARTAASRNFVW